MNLGELAKEIGGTLADAASAAIKIEGIAPIQSAAKGTITFLTNADYARYLDESAASAIIVGKELDKSPMPQLIHQNPYWAFAKVSQLFYPKKIYKSPVEHLSWIDPSAQVAEDAVIYPFVFIGPEAEIGKGTVVFPGTYIGSNVSVGADCLLHPNVFLGDGCRVGQRVIIHAGTVIGADGFGFAPGEKDIAKIPQKGIVVIDDDVELGGVCTVDRAAFGETKIGPGSKLDSKVHVGHNVTIGKNSMFSALTGIAGSTTIGDWVLMGGHSGVSGHLHVKDRVKVGAMTGVVQKTEEGETYMGFPGTPAKEWKRGLVYQKRLPDYEKRVKDLEAKVARLTELLDKDK